MKLNISYHYIGDPQDYFTYCADLEDIKYFLDNLVDYVIFDELSFDE